MKKTVSVACRVEGHGEINYFMADDQIHSVYFEISGIRGFENILKGKKLEDVPKIIPRICGLCSASQTTVSIKTIEDIFGIKPSEETNRLRQLLMIGDHIKSHITHIFFQSFPDLLYILKDEKNYQGPNSIIKYDPEITSNMFDLIKNSKNIVNTLGGRSLHSVTPAIGGFYYYPNKKNMDNVKKSFEKSIENLKSVIDKFTGLFMNSGAPSEYLSFENPVFMSLQNKNAYDIYEGNLRIQNNGDILKEFTPHQYEKYIYREGAAGVYLDYEGEKTLMVGPIARYKTVKKYGDEEVDQYLEYFNKPWETNLLSANFLGLLELLYLSKKCISMIETSDLTNPKGVPREGISNKGFGIGAVEAPRGTLIHHYEVDDNNLIKRARLYIPTEMNIPTMNKLLTSFCKKFYGETQDLELMKKYAQMIVRAFDPCISCATHIVNLRSK